MLRWEKNTRYYQASLHQDLLGDWVVFLMWGSRHSALGASRSILVKNQLEGQQRLNEIQHKRLKRGYREVRTAPLGYLLNK